MPNKKNLKPNSERTPRERKELAQKAGKKSGEARRARKTLKEELLILLSTGNMQKKLSLAILQQALEGNVKAYIAIRDTLGENPTLKQEIKSLNDYTPTVYITRDDLNNPEKLKDITGKADKCYIKVVSEEEEREVQEHIRAVIGD